MPAGPPPRVNPFASPIKTIALSAPNSTSATAARAQQPNVLATADLFVEQLKELENRCSTVEERVQHKRQALKELEYLILGSNPDGGSPRSPACPANTPINSRLCLLPPRLRGLFDLHGPGQVNLDATQTCLDYSPESQVGENLSTREDPGHSNVWEDVDEEAQVSPFDDKYELPQSPIRVDKKLCVISCDSEEVGRAKIPRKVDAHKQASASSACSVKEANVIPDLGASKGTMRRGSWKRSILKSARTEGGRKVSSTIENGTVKEVGRSRKEKRKGLWSIYSVCSELGLSGTHPAA